MIVTEVEKRVLQKHYVERIKSYVSNLNQIIEKKDVDALMRSLLEIKTAASRIEGIEHGWGDWSNQDNKTEER